MPFEGYIEFPGNNASITVATLHQFYNLGPPPYNMFDLTKSIYTTETLTVYPGVWSNNFIHDSTSHSNVKYAESFAGDENQHKPAPTNISINDFRGARPFVYFRYPSVNSGELYFLNGANGFYPVSGGTSFQKYRKDSVFTWTLPARSPFYLHIPYVTFTIRSYYDPGDEYDDPDWNFVANPGYIIRVGGSTLSELIVSDLPHQVTGAYRSSSTNTLLTVQIPPGFPEGTTIYFDMTVEGATGVQAFEDPTVSAVPFFMALGID